MDVSQLALYELLFDRVAEAGLANRVADVVLAAFEGDAALSVAVAGTGSDDRGAPQQRPAVEQPPEIFLEKVTVSGFRGIGPVSTLPLRPGPGLTLVVGRNGSGKSSFAEAIELAMTGDSYRWSGRSSVWRDGWRNLHKPDPAALDVTVSMEGEPGPTIIRRSWTADANLDNSVSTLQPYGKARQPWDGAGWSGPLQTYRPFLSYAELGALVDGKPSEMFDALQAILGLDQLVAAEKRLGDTRKRLEDICKAPKRTLPTIISELDGCTDPRAARAVEAVSGRSWDLDAAEAIATGTVQAVQSEDQQALTALLRLQVPPDEQLTDVCDQLRSAVATLVAVAGTPAVQARNQARLLRAALEHHGRVGDGPCPVCRTGALDENWRQEAVEQINELESAATVAESADQQLRAALSAGHGLVSPLPAVLRPRRGFRH